MTIKKVHVLVFSFCLAACSYTEKASDDQKVYFDVRGFFLSEAARLEKSKPSVSKTAVLEGKPETKHLVITDWETELSHFIEADINKPAWRNSYKKDGSANAISYTAIDSSLRTRQIAIVQDQKGGVKSISIRTHLNNPLYSSSETLFYSPDSIYSIRKQQDVLILGKNSFEISGLFKNK